MSVIAMPEALEAPLFSFDTTASCLLRMRLDRDLEIAAAQRRTVGAGATTAVSDLISVAGEFGFQAEHARLDWQDLQKSRPGDRILALLKNGNVVILICGERPGEEIAVWDPLNRKSGVFTVDCQSLEANWDGHALIMTRLWHGEETASASPISEPEPARDVPTGTDAEPGPQGSIERGSSEWAPDRRNAPRSERAAALLPDADLDITETAPRHRGLIGRLAAAVIVATTSFGIVYLLDPGANNMAATTSSLIEATMTLSRSLASTAEAGSPRVPAASLAAAPLSGTAAMPTDPAAPAQSPPDAAEGSAIAPAAGSMVPAEVLSDEGDEAPATGATVPLVTRATGHPVLPELASIQRNDAARSVAMTAPRSSPGNLALCGGTFRKALDEVGSPAAYRRYIGVWAGRWSNGTCAGLIISKVAADRTATITYVYRRNGIAEPNLYQQQRAASIDADGNLYFLDDEGGRCIFSLGKAGRLTVTYVTKARKSATTVFERQS